MQLVPAHTIIGMCLHRYRLAEIGLEDFYPGLQQWTMQVLPPGACSGIGKIDYSA
jgi:hypothetical protein